MDSNATATDEMTTGTHIVLEQCICHQQRYLRTLYQGNCEDEGREARVAGEVLLGLFFRQHCSLSSRMIGARKDAYLFPRVQDATKVVRDSTALQPYTCSCDRLADGTKNTEHLELWPVEL